MKDWELFEEDVAEYLDGSRQPGSGCSPISGKKGDIKSDDYLVECKCTSKDFYTLSKGTWDKIVDEAMFAYKVPLFAARSKVGDYFVGSYMDFPIECDESMECPKNIKLKGHDCFLVTGFSNMDLVCWKVDLKEKDDE